MKEYVKCYIQNAHADPGYTNDMKGK